MTTKEKLIDSIMEQSKVIEGLRKDVKDLENGEDQAWKINHEVYLAVLNRKSQKRNRIDKENQELIKLYLKLDAENKRLENNRQTRRNSIINSMYGVA